MDFLSLADYGDKSVKFSRTIAESDVYLFAGITGDVAPYHTDEAMMRDSVYGGRIAHGVLILGLVSTASTHFWGEVSGRGKGVSYGYDSVRFIDAVRLGDTLTVTYTVVGVDPERRLVKAKGEVTNERGRTVLAATHLTKIIDL